jgi:hypothetical protein
MKRQLVIKMAFLFAGILALGLVVGFTQGEESKAPPPLQTTSDCITCHITETPGVVTQWQKSKMSATLDCSICHGTAHVSANDVDKVLLPTPDTCKPCHSKQVTEFMASKHALAWTAMNAMPMVAHQPSAIVTADGFKGCSSCHKIGIKSAEEMADPDFIYGTASCDSCHTRHAFSKAEAQDPRACQTCHMGFDHPQWEMWSTSKHGTIWQIDGGSTRAPKCQDCHLANGTHTNMTAWGFLALRVPEDDPDWWADRVVILKAMGVLDENGEGTERLDAVAAAKIARLTKEDFDKERAKMVATCESCHAEGFVEQQISSSDDMIREADKMMAEAITIVNGLYKDGYLKAPEEWKYAPDLLQFYDSTSSIEHELFTMFLEYRQRTFQGAFHANPDYMYWYGYASMQNSLQFIKDEAANIRASQPAVKADNSGTDIIGIIALCIGVVALAAASLALYRKKPRG